MQITEQELAALMTECALYWGEPDDCGDGIWLFYDGIDVAKLARLLSERSERP